MWQVPNQLRTRTTNMAYYGMIPLAHQFPWLHPVHHNLTRDLLFSIPLPTVSGWSLHKPLRLIHYSSQLVRFPHRKFFQPTHSLALSNARVHCKASEWPLKQMEMLSNAFLSTPPLSLHADCSMGCTQLSALSTKLLKIRGGSYLKYSVRAHYVLM